MNNRIASIFPYIFRICILCMLFYFASGYSYCIIQGFNVIDNNNSSTKKNKLLLDNGSRFLLCYNDDCVEGANHDFYRRQQADFYALDRIKFDHNKMNYEEYNNLIILNKRWDERRKESDNYIIVFFRSIKNSFIRIFNVLFS